MCRKVWLSAAGGCLPANTCPIGRNCAALAGRYPSVVETVPLDVGSSESVAAAQQVKGRCDHLDLVINNAGIDAGRSGVREGWTGRRCIGPTTSMPQAPFGW